MISSIRFLACGSMETTVYFPRHMQLQWKCRGKTDVRPVPCAYPGSAESEKMTLCSSTRLTPVNNFPGVNAGSDRAVDIIA